MFRKLPGIRNCTYFVRHSVEAWSLDLGRCSHIQNIQDLHWEGVKATDEVRHDDWSLGIKNE